jgi:hypothetical protein
LPFTLNSETIYPVENITDERIKDMETNVIAAVIFIMAVAVSISIARKKKK